MIALYNFLPLYYPSWGTPTRLDRIANAMVGKFKAKQAVLCGICMRCFTAEQIRQQTLAERGAHHF
jgi:uncharacterized membrane protein